MLTSGKYQFAGGGAGDDAKFAQTHVFFGAKAYTDAVVALELLSVKPLGIGVGHGWTPAGKALRVTEAVGMRLVSLNGLPAVDAFEEHARTTGQPFDRNVPLPFFLHNILGIDTGSSHRLRVPLAVNPDGSVNCAAEIPSGRARVHHEGHGRFGGHRRQEGDRICRPGAPGGNSRARRSSSTVSRPAFAWGTSSDSNSSPSRRRSAAPDSSGATRTVRSRGRKASLVAFTIARLW